MVTAGQRAESLVRPPTEFALKIIQGAKGLTTGSLLTECARALDFPDYFGHDWDALEECLTDLEWLPAKGYILLITDAACVLPDDEEEYETFLEILRDAGEAWGTGQAEMGARRANAISRTVRCIGTGESQAGPLGDERNPCGTDPGGGNTASDSLETDLAECICPTTASSWSHSVILSSGRVNDTIRSRPRIVRRHESMPASGLRRRDDERHRSHAFLAHRREGPFRPPAPVSLLVGTTNR